MLISIIITIKNEAKTISKLIDSLIIQDEPFEIIIIDSESNDGTKEIIKVYIKKNLNIKLYNKQSTRGIGRNFGVSKSKGDFVAFVDGGCIAHKDWLRELKSKINNDVDIIAGKTINIGKFKETKRVKIFHKGYDITYPSCNILYRKNIFNKINGFDGSFITAEDIDLNFRAINVNAKLMSNEKAIIYRSSASDLFNFMKQSFWYGYGRKQLNLKHGNLWKDYSSESMIKEQLNFKGSIRLFFGLFGYIFCSIDYIWKK